MANFTKTILIPLLLLIQISCAQPLFESYYDNNASFTKEGWAVFEADVFNTNGSVFVDINNSNFTANINESWLTFLGTSAYAVDIGNESVAGDNFSFAMCVNATLKGNYSRIAGREEQFGLLFDNSFDHKFRFEVRNTTTLYALTGTSAPETNTTWYCIGGTYDSIQTRLYVDGVVENTGTANLVGVLNTSTVNITLGGTSGSSLRFSGGIDDVYYSNETLSAVQMARIANESSKKLGRSIPILSYHQVDDEVGASTIVNQSEFDTQMEYLGLRSFSSITLEKYYNWTLGLEDIQENSVVIMFDDGLMSVFSNTSSMDDNSLDGTLAVIYEKVGADGYMSWDDIKTFKNKGWEVVGHGLNALTTMSVEEMEGNLSLIRNETENQLGVTPYLFVYPNNLHNDSIDELCDDFYLMCSGDAGGDTAPTYLYAGTNKTNGISRTIIDNETTLEQFQDVVYFRDNLIGEWHFDEGIGNTSADLSGNGNTATITTPLWNTEGRYNTSVWLESPGVYPYQWLSWDSGGVYNVTELFYYAVGEGGVGSEFMQFFMPVLLIIVAMLFILGFVIRDRFFQMFAGFNIAILGVSLPSEGFYNLDNEFLLLSTTVVFIGLAAWLILYNSYMLIMEGWGGD